MCNATMMLVSTDPSLIEAVLGVLPSISNLQPVIVAGIDEARARLERDNPCVVLVHQPQGQGVDAITRWLREVGARKRTVPTLVVSDQYQADQALSLHRLGVADYLSRPLDLNRLA